ncbi:MAG: ATP-binding protein [Nocardioidaceae bacterium]|nr:ATP-binding protein [Nocardioidaceae bacterium]
MTTSSAEEWIRGEFETLGPEVVGVETRTFPQEAHHIVYVLPDEIGRALVLGNRLQPPTVGGVDEFVIVRVAPDGMLEGVGTQHSGPIRSVHDERCSELINLVSARSRVSNAQPSLAYVPDARPNLAAVTAARHHLVFGRRGAGKTALLVEAKQQLDNAGAVTTWVNIQTYRRETPQRVVLYVLNEMLASLLATRALDEKSQVVISLSKLSAKVQSLLDADETSDRLVHDLVPRAQRVLRDYLSVASRPLFVFLDDYYYLPRSEHPEVLDILHGFTRDANVWLKVASIKHLTRWWQATPPVGLQSGQDADLIDLDITLQEPADAKRFLEGVLLAFAQESASPRCRECFEPRP